MSAIEPRSPSLACGPSPSGKMKWYLAPIEIPAEVAKSCPASGREPERTASTDTSGSLRLAPEVPAGLERPRGDWPPGSLGGNDVPIDADVLAGLRKAAKRASFLSDEAGRLVTDNRELLAENARLRRALERAERKSTKPRGGGRP